MYRIMLQKLRHKKWMNLCLLLGSILLIATVVSFPLYQTAAYDRMLQDEFRNYLSTEGKWPAMNSLTVISKKDRGGITVARMEELMGHIYSDLGVTEKETVCYYSMSPMNIHSDMNRQELENASLRLGAFSDLPEHIELLSGEAFSEDGRTEDGCIEVLVSQAAMVNRKLLVGETLVFNDMKDPEGGQIKLYVKGVFAAGADSGFYWQVDPESLDNTAVMDMDLFRGMFTGENAGKYSYTCYYYPMFEYEDIKAEQVEGLIAATDYLTETGPFNNTADRPAYRDILDSYCRKQTRIRTTLMILQIPVLIMLGAFLFMISGQMYDMERNEISVIKSRGSSGGQIFRLYLYQCTLLTLAGGGLGIPLGTVFSRILGSARSFLEFDSLSTLTLTFTREVWLYAAAAMLAVLLIMTLPAVKHSRVTIVKLKQQKALKKKSWWEKIFLDVILLGISLYGYFSFRRNSAGLGESVLEGKSLDPLLYVSSSLFIVGLGLLFLRMQPYLIQLVYMAGKRFWRPASYASFMENAKNGRKQQFIMLFLIITVSLGMYHATVARTILQNAYSNAEYMNGADIMVQEVWRAVTDRNGAYTGDYSEPDYAGYASMDFAEGYTRVQLSSEAYVETKDGARQNATVMGIHTKEFGELTWVDYELNHRHYYEYLNDLAVDADGILVSDNFRTKLGCEIGDRITYGIADVTDGKNGSPKTLTGKILGFFTYWPGYAPTVTEINPDGTVTTEENLLVVTHYGVLRQKLGVRPYQVWIGLKEGRSAAEAYAWFQENGIRLTKYTDKAAELEKTVEDPLLQGTNGVLTMGFLVTILLCAVGYLIYWIMSIRSREMIFGVLRACGMHKGELIHMLLNEQIFSGVLSVLAGVGIGKLASGMFVPILQQAYAAADQVLPMKLVINGADMGRLYGVIGGVMLLCLLILILLIFKLNVTKALKLGEE
ncbi:MAG: ABC transporter permease [Butyrivibrio sp.]|nr:ABC transporter permease [Acetatifactor muris]MCM1559411.1 ABC transporter permease [Butyrivibrio sp.]